MDNTQANEEFRKLFRKKAKDGDSIFQFQVGLCYLKGYSGASQSNSKAEKWLQLSAVHGHLEANGLLEFCNQHYWKVDNEYLDTFVSMKSDFALLLHQKAREYDAGFQHVVGLCYLRSYGGVTQDYNEAIKWLKLSADQGLDWAQSELGYCYQNGWGVEVDFVEAVRLYKLAADQGSAFAQINLGQFYETGTEVAQDYNEAAQLYILAGDGGNWRGYYNAGNIYSSDNGLKKDLSKAKMLFEKAQEMVHLDDRKAHIQGLIADIDRQLVFEPG